MALNIKAGNGGTGYITPVKAYTKIDGAWTPVKKVFLNNTELELKTSEKLEYQLSLTNRTLSNQIVALEEKALSTPLTVEEQTNLNTFKESQKIVKVEQVELSKQINIVKTEQIITRSIIKGADLITTLKDAALVSEISFKVIEVSQLTPTLENVDLVFINDYYFYGRYYKIIDLRTENETTILNNITTRLGTGTFNYQIRNIKETLTVLALYLQDASTEAQKKIETIQKQHSFVEANMGNIVETVTNTPASASLSLIKTTAIVKNTDGTDNIVTTELDPNKKVGDILLKMYQVPNLTDLNIDSVTTMQYNSDITRQKEILNIVNENVEILNTVTTKENTDINEIATVASKLFVKEVTTVNETTGETTVVSSTNTLTEFYDMNLSRNITTAPAGTIEVSKVYGNPKPIIESIINQTIFEDTSFVFSYNTYDLEDGTVINFEANAQNGTVVLNTVNKTVTYYSKPDFFGTDIITLLSTDNENETTVYQIPVTVQNVNDNPRFVNLTVNTNGTEETTFELPFSVYDLEDPNQLVQISNITATSVLGICEIVQTDTETKVVLTPYENVFGSGNIIITARDIDGAVTTKIVTINLAGTPDAPTIDFISDKTIDEDGSVVLWPLNWDTCCWLPFVKDVDGGTPSRSYTSVAGATIWHYENVDGRQTLVYQAPANFYGVDTVTLTATDATGLTASRTFTVTINSVNDAPIITIESTKTINEDGQVKIYYSLTDVDILENDIEFYTVSVVSCSDTTAQTILNNDENGYYLEYIPTKDYYGATTITLKFLDNTEQTETYYLRTVNINVLNIDDAPVVTILSDITINEDTATEISFEIFDIDTISHILNATALNGTVTINPTTKILRYTPNENFFGMDTITFTVSDTLTTITKIVNMDINSVNDIPTLIFDYIKVLGNGDAEIKVSLSDNDTLDNPYISRALSTNNPNAIITIDTESKNKIYYNANGYEGSDTITYYITDGKSTEQEFTVTFNVINSDVYNIPYMIGVIDNTIIDRFLSTDFNDSSNSGVLMEAVLWKI